MKKIRHTFFLSVPRIPLFNDTIVSAGCQIIPLDHHWYVTCLQSNLARLKKKEKYICPVSWLLAQGFTWEQLYF